MNQREIKFRVWNSAKKQWFTPIYEAYKGKLHDISISLGGQIIERTLEHCADIRNTHDFIISQFTGLKDKNGVDIYEGDICNAFIKLWVNKNPLLCQIIYNNELAQFQPVQWWESQLKWLPFMDNFKNYEFEVIGNIYEHPHLLK